MKKGANMPDKLKDHIEENRGDFDLYPFEANWSKIADHLEKDKKPPLPKILVAASLTLLLVSFSVLWISQNSDDAIPREVVEMEHYYTHQIDQKVQLIKNDPRGNEILMEIEEMDAAFSELKDDLNDNIDNQEVIRAMMENYRFKLEMLERILNKLEEENVEQDL